MQALENIIKRIINNRSHYPNDTAIKSDLDILNNVLEGGFRKGQLYVVAGKESIGKTSFIVSLVADIVSSNTSSVGVIAMNISEEIWMARLFSSVSEVWLESILSGRVLHDDLEIIKRVVSLPRFDKLKLWANGYLTIDDLISTSTEWVLNDDVQIIFIDHLQLISLPGINDQELKIFELSKVLKGMAQVLDVPVIIEVEVKSKKGISNLKQLRKVGAVENFADVIMFLNKRLKDSIEQRCNEQEIFVSIEKNNHGRLDTIKLRSLLHVQKFLDMKY
jgi:replicative DNA helicase